MTSNEFLQENIRTNNEPIIIDIDILTRLNFNKH